MRLLRGHPRQRLLSVFSAEQAIDPGQMLYHPLNLRQHQHPPHQKLPRPRTTQALCRCNEAAITLSRARGAIPASTFIKNAVEHLRLAKD